MVKTNKDLILLDAFGTAYRAIRETQNKYNLSPLQLAILLCLASTSSKGVPSLTATELLYYIYITESNSGLIYDALIYLCDEAQLLERTKAGKAKAFSINADGLAIARYCIQLSKEFTEDYNTLAQSI